MNHDNGSSLSPLLRLSLCSVALLGVLPFLQPYHRSPLTSFYNEWLALGLGLGVFAVLLDRRMWEHAEVPWVALSPFGLAGLLIIHGSLGWSPYSGQALLGALYLVWAGLLVIAGRALVSRCGADRVLATAAAGLAVGALLSAATGVIQHFNLITPLNEYIVRLHGPAVFGNLAQPNHFAAHVTLGLFSLAWLQARARLPLPAAILCSLPLLFVLGISGSRSVWLYLLAAFLCAGLLRRLSADREARSLFLWTGFFLVSHYLMQVMVDQAWFKSPERETVTAVERLFSGAGSVADRLGLWRAAWEIGLGQPFFGVGWGAFAGRYFQFVAEPGALAPAGLYNNAHNILLQVFAETGLAGLLLLLAPLLPWGGRVMRARPDAGQWWLAALLGVFVLHSLLEYPLWYAYFLGIAALLLGFAGGPVFVPQLARLGRVFAATVILVGGYNLAYLWTDYRQFEVLFRPSPEQLRSIDFPVVMSRLHRNTLLAPYVELASVFPLEVAEENLQGRLLLNGQVLRFTPVAVPVYRQALLLALAGKLPEAREQLARARRVYPRAPLEFDRDLARLLREHPARFRPLLESGVNVPGSG